MIHVSTRTRLSRIILAAALGASALVANVGAVSARECDGIYYSDLCDVRAYIPQWEEDCPQCGQIFVTREDDWRVLFDQQSFDLAAQFQLRR